MNIPFSTIEALESGEESPHPSLLVDLANFYRVSTGYLLGNVPNTKYKTLGLPKLNNLTPTVKSTLIKAMDELGELAHVIGKFSNMSGETNVIEQEELLSKLCSELLDVSQTTVSLMFVLEEKYGIDITKKVNKHIKKLIKKIYSLA